MKDDKFKYERDNELEIFSILGRHFSVNEPYGYITSGGTESNHACLWWNQKYLVATSDYDIKEIKSQIEDLKT